MDESKNQMNVPSSGLLSRKEAAVYLRVAESTIAQWQSNGKEKIPCVKVGGKYFYLTELLDQWIKQHCVNQIDNTEDGENDTKQ